MSTPLNQIRLDDGFSTTIELENNPVIKLYERQVTPPGVSAGGAIAITTMRNLAWRTNSPKKLKTLSPWSAVCAYATSAIYTAAVAQIGINQRLTISFADGSSLRIWGWLEEVSPAAFTEGEQPTATVTIHPSLHDNNGVEVAPDYRPPGVGTSGT